MVNIIKHGLKAKKVRDMMIRNFKITVIIIGIAVMMAACAKKRPVLYPNVTYNTAGPAIAQANIDQCIKMAADHGLEKDTEKDVAVTTAKGATTGAVVGGAVGAVRGRPGKGAAVGAAGGGSAGMMHEAWKSGDPDDIERRFIEQCLRDKGYQVIGWK